MELLRDSLKKRLVQKKLDKHAIGVLAINAAKRFLSLDELQGYVKFDKLFLITRNQNLKMKIFLEKKVLLEQVNISLEKVGYTTKIREVYLKAKSFEID